MEFNMNGACACGSSKSVADINSNRSLPRDEFIRNGFFTKVDSVINSIEMVNGKVDLNKCMLGDENGDRNIKRLFVHNGVATVSNGTKVYGAIDVENGHFTAKSAHIYGDVLNNNGLISLKKSHVYGNITVRRGTIDVEASEVKGIISVNADTLTIGKGSFVEHLHMGICENSKKSVVVSDNITMICASGSGMNIESGTLYFKYGNVSTRYGYESSRSKKCQQTDVDKNTQKLTLEAGSTLKKLSFSGDECELTLRDGACYEGDRNIKGLFIKN